MEINKNIFDDISKYKYHEDVRMGKNIYRISLSKLFKHDGWFESLVQFELNVKDYTQVNALLNEFCECLASRGYFDFNISSTLSVNYDSFSATTETSSDTFISFKDDFDVDQINKYRKQEEEVENRKKLKEENLKLKAKANEEKLKKAAEKKEKELYDKLKKKFDSK
jgi:hypothetical protein